MEIKVQLSVKLGGAFRGQEIVDAVREVAGSEFYFQESSVTDDGVAYEVGVNSQHPAHDVAVAVNEPTNKDVFLNELYSKVYVVYSPRGGVKWAVGYGKEEIIRAVTAFRDALEQKLSAPRAQMPAEPDQDREIRFAYDGVQYAVGMRASDLNRIVLPDGTVLAAGGWLESLPPQPANLREIANPYKGRATAKEIARMLNGELAEEVKS